MAQKEILVAYGIDVDAVAGWLGSYGGEDSPDDISRGLFAGEIGTPRLLKLFDKYSLKTTWFIPGHSLETFPEQMRMVVEAGHEIGAHGYAHENPIAMTRQQEEDVLRTCVGLIEQVTGRRPAGYVAPWWEFSNVTNELLLQYGFKYGLSSLLCTRRRSLDENRLRPAGRDLDAATGARARDRSHRDPRQLVSG
jgi:peptidoglycan/xylan/chitin deacetylase (PgdA/CDA1 family)